MFAVNTTLGLNVVDGYVTSFYVDHQNPSNNIYDFDKEQYDLEYMGAYKLGNNELILDPVKKAEIEAQKQEEQKQARIAELKEYLNSTDYIYNSIREGGRTEEYYADVIERRKAARREIQELEG